jgi:hypothetical protein
MVNRTTHAVKIFLIDCLTYRDEKDIFFEGLNILISSLDVCAYGFNFSRSHECFSRPYTIINFLFASLKLLTNFENAY